MRISVKVATHRRCSKAMTNIPRETYKCSSIKKAISKYRNSDFRICDFKPQEHSLKPWCVCAYCKSQGKECYSNNANFLVNSSVSMFSHIPISRSLASTLHNQSKLHRNKSIRKFYKY